MNNNDNNYTSTATTTASPTSTPEIMIRPDDTYSDLSDGQNIAIAVSTIPPGLLSIVGSTCIIYSILRTKQKNSRDSYDRIMLALSAADIFLSLFFPLNSFLTPEYRTHRNTSFGNDHTCNMLGFVMQISMASFFYNGMLNLYYYTTIVKGWTPTKFAKYEPYMHAFILTFTLSTATLGLAADWYDAHEIGRGCWVANVPDGCGLDPWRSGEPCVSPYIAWLFGSGAVISFVFVVVVNVHIYCHVRTTLQRSSQYSFRIRSKNQNNMNQKRPRVMVTTTTTRSDPRQEKIRQVATQCFLYVLAFWISVLPTTIIRNLEGQYYPPNQESRIFWLVMVQSLLTPSLGTFNVLIFFRRRYNSLRSDFHDKSRVWAMCRAVCNDAPKCNKNSRATKNQKNCSCDGSNAPIAKMEEQEQSCCSVCKDVSDNSGSNSSEFDQADNSNSCTANWFTNSSVTFQFGASLSSPSPMAGSSPISFLAGSDSNPRDHQVDVLAHDGSLRHDDGATDEIRSAEDCG